MRIGLAIVIVALGFAATPTLAQDQSAPVSPAPPASSGPATGTLACLNSGNQYKVGEFACIPACHGQRRLARCDAAAQTASWTYVSETCPSAMINEPWPSDWSMVPVVTSMSPAPVVVTMSAIPPDKRITFTDFTKVRLASR